eukprot:3777607-Amphidinium_carterae.1
MTQGQTATCVWVTDLQNLQPLHERSARSEHFVGNTVSWLWTPTKIDEASGVHHPLETKTLLLARLTLHCPKPCRTYDSC